jgi:hypothetical protein
MMATIFEVLLKPVHPTDLLSRIHKAIGVATLGPAAANPAQAALPIRARYAEDLK